MNNEKQTMNKGVVATIIVVAILLIDQAIKLWVKTSMELHESIHVFDWFYITFIENNGMAYGMQLGSKLLLSLFRLIAISVLGYYVWRQVKTGARWGYVVCLSMILAGAVGNLIDCMFYGMIFEQSTPYHIAQFTAFGEGYSSFLMGRVVDMFYFPLIVSTWPDWVPWYGGDEFIFFSPVFNFADANISVGVVVLLLFFRKELGDISLSRPTEKAAPVEENQQSE